MIPESFSFPGHPGGTQEMNARAGSWVAGALATTLIVFGCTQGKKATVASGIAWNQAYDATLTDAGTHHRPILLDFYTDW